jgi:voltage-gated sodium channel
MSLVSLAAGATANRNVSDKESTKPENGDGAPSAPPNLCHRIVHAQMFQRFIIVVILMAGAIVGIETSPSLSHDALHYLHILDKGIFIAEMLLKMGADWPRPWNYFREGWNSFDFIIVAGCLLPAGGSFMAVLRMFRVLRVLRLMTAVPKLQQLVAAMLKSLPSMGYVCMLLGLLFYVYAVAGVMFFGKNDPVHFGTLGRAFLTLFGVVTLENWVEIMNIQRLGSLHFEAYATQLTAMGAVSHAAPALAVGYFVSFVLIGTMVMLNLLIGVIINGMDEAQREMLENEIERAGPRLDPAEQLQHRLGELKAKVAEIEELLRR